MTPKFSSCSLLGLVLLCGPALPSRAQGVFSGGLAGSGGDNATVDYRVQLNAARRAYFKDLEGDHAADAEARREFALLSGLRPADPVVLAYKGSLDLLLAGRTWAFWNKHVLAQQGLAEMDHAVDEAPDNLEARFIRGATTWHLPFFFHRRQQAESDFAAIAPQAEAAAQAGALPAPLAASALDYYGQILAGRNDQDGAKKAFEAALRVDSGSPAGKDAAKRLR